MEQSTIIWALRESQKLQETWPIGSRPEQELIAYWRRNRPKMVKTLEEADALAALAHVLHNRMLDAEMAYLRAGMPPTDARGQAEQEWLLMEPEEPEAEDESL